MDELNSHARALLDAANTFDDPTDLDRDRVRAAVLMRVGSVAAVYRYGRRREGLVRGS